MIFCTTKLGIKHYSYPIASLTSLSPCKLLPSQFSGPTYQHSNNPTDFLVMQYLPISSLPPLYSVCFPFLKTFNVGYPVTPNSCASSGSFVASTLPSKIGTSRFFNCFAAFSYSGANLLQCPHLLNISPQPCEKLQGEPEESSNS